MLRRLGLFNLEKALQIPYSSLAVLKGAYRKASFVRGCSDRTRGKGLKLTDGRFRWGIRKKFAPMKLVRHWHWCPESCGCLSLEVTQARLDGLWVTWSDGTGTGWTLGPIQPQPCCDFWRCDQSLPQYSTSPMDFCSSIVSFIFFLSNSKQVLFLFLSATGN